MLASFYGIPNGFSSLKYHFFQIFSILFRMLRFDHDSPFTQSFTCKIFAIRAVIVKSNV